MIQTSTTRGDSNLKVPGKDMQMLLFTIGTQYFDTICIEQCLGTSDAGFLVFIASVGSFWLQWYFFLFIFFLLECSPSISVVYYWQVFLSPSTDSR